MIKIFKIILFTPLILSFYLQNLIAAEKIKIGLLIPLTGKDSVIGESITKATRLAVNKINDQLIEIIPKDTNSNPDKTFSSALELQELGVKIVIGPVFQKI